MSNTIGWGKGASNNSIGWGNLGTNGFGSIYNRSNSGETDLSGQEVNVFQDAAVAYSLRDLGLGAEHVVRVRRSLDNVEQDFTASEIIDSTLTSFCGVGDGFVSIWYNQKGGNNATQTSASIQPKIVSLGSLVLDNGKPSIDFTSDQFLNLSNNLVTNNNPLSYFNVGFYSLSNSNGSLAIEGNIGQADAIFLTSEIAVRTGAGTKIFNSTANITQSLLSLFFEGTNINDFLVSKNGNLLSQRSLNDNNFDLGDNTTSTIYLKVEGKLSESILFTENIINKREEIETNINNYYAIY